jgi:catechol 2,3-dioxygenase-like lactoylglutathione lyase family enzyme
MDQKSVFPRMHVSLYVKDLTATVNFYTNFFGIPATKIKHRYAKYVLDSPSLIISFVENAERVQQNFGHLGFQVETLEQLNDRLVKAEAQNLVSKKEIGTACCYAKQDKFWVNDPDGVQWEVYYFHEDAEFNDPHYELSDTSSCCMPSDALESVKAPAIELVSAPKIDKVACGCGVESTCC